MARRLFITGLSWRGALVIAACALAAAALDRAALALDLSPDRRFSVQPALRELLNRHGAGTTITAFWNSDVAAALAPVDGLLTRIAATTPGCTWRQVDPQLDPAARDAFAARHGAVVPPALFVERDGRALPIPLSGELSRTMQRELGAALLALTDPTPPRAVLTQGHGELRPGGGPEDGGDQLRQVLERAGFRTAALAAGARPPAEALVVVAGPTAAFEPAELDDLDRHLADGGGLLVFADDRMPTALAQRLARRGALTAAGVPRRLAAGAVGGLDDLLAADTPTLDPVVLVSRARHEVGAERGLPHHRLLLEGAGHIDAAHPASAGTAAGGRALLSPRTTPVEPLPERLLTTALRDRLAPLRITPWQSSPLLATAPHDSWTKRHDDPALIEPDDLATAEPRPLALALAYAPTPDSARSGTGGRLAVWGSRQAVSDAVLARERFANARLVADLASWCAQRRPPTGIPEAALTAYQLDAGDRAQWLLLALVAAVLPSLCIGGALMAWIARRR